MNVKRFDGLTRSLASGASRRVLLASVATGLVALLPQGKDAEAKRKRKKKKKKTVVPPPVSPPAGCIATCANRVCGPDSCGGGSCGDCGICKNCEGGACFNKTNGTGCGGECLECQGGACVARAKGTPCTGGVCVGGVCCTLGERICGAICCPAGTLCIDADNGRCAPVCDATCNPGRAPRCGCAVTFDTDIDYCNVNPDFDVICAQPACDSQEDCAPDKVCSNVTCGGAPSQRCLDACPA